MFYANSPNNQPLPQLWVMLSLGLTVDQLRSNDVSHGISHEDSGCHDGFLGSASYIAGTDSDDEANHGTKEAGERITRYRCGWVISPLRLPDHCTPGYYRKTASNEHRNPSIRETSGDVSTEWNENDTNPSNGKLK